MFGARLGRHFPADPPGVARPPPLIYADYAPNSHEAELVELAFKPADPLGVEPGKGVALPKTRH